MSSYQKKPFSKSRKFSNFRVTNWSEYNNALRNRGRIDFMIADDLSDGWYEERPIYSKKGRQKRFSDLAILQCLQIRYLFGLKLRQVQGFIDWIFDMVGLPLKSPDYTTLSRRSKKLCLKDIISSPDKEFNHICVDSTGIRTYSGNEWLEDKHGKSYERRIWKKLHIAIDDEGNIVANSLTDHGKDDRTQLPVLLKTIKAKEFLADTGYDGEDVYNQIRQQGMRPIIRPPNSAISRKLNQDKTERQEAVDYQEKNGYHAWRKKNKYGRRERVENTFYRFKTSVGDKFLSREGKNMENEMRIKCQLLNKMFQIGKPISMRFC